MADSRLTQNYTPPVGIGGHFFERFERDVNRFKALVQIDAAKLGPQRRGPERQFHRVNIGLTEFLLIDIVVNRATCVAGPAYC